MIILLLDKISLTIFKQLISLTFETLVVVLEHNGSFNYDKGRHRDHWQLEFGPELWKKKLFDMQNFSIGNFPTYP